MDGGQTWEQCNLTSPPAKHAWVRWDYTWDAFKKGKYTIKSKATDSEGKIQPVKPLWNKSRIIYQYK